MDIEISERMNSPCLYLSYIYIYICMELLKPNFDKEYREAWDKKEPSPLLEAGIEQQACLGLYRFHEAE
jgi:hypothetical protein